jgi:periplasmic protein TonB
MAIMVAFESPTIQINPADIGDPLSKLPNGALGLAGHDGIGLRPGCCGIGEGENGRSGITAISRPGHIVSAPILIEKVEPEFSEPARKAKYQGTVVLSIEVDTNGRARGFRILRSPGLGLDEKAIEAVQKWKFRPGYQDGKPVVTMATVEVNFRLL